MSFPREHCIGILRSRARVLTPPGERRIEIVTFDRCCGCFQNAPSGLDPRYSAFPVAQVIQDLGHLRRCHRSEDSQELPSVCCRPLDLRAATASARGPASSQRNSTTFTNRCPKSRPDLSNFHGARLPPGTSAEGQASRSGRGVLPTGHPVLMAPVRSCVGIHQRVPLFVRVLASLRLGHLQALARCPSACVFVRTVVAGALMRRGPGMYAEMRSEPSPPAIACDQGPRRGMPIAGDFLPHRDRVPTGPPNSRVPARLQVPDKRSAGPQTPATLTLAIGGAAAISQVSAAIVRSMTPGRGPLVNRQ